MRTTQNLQPAALPRLNIPRLRSRIETESDEDPLRFLKYPFQSSSGGEGGAQSYASSSVTVKRPHNGDDIEAQASAYASVNDVNDEEHIAEIFGNFDDSHYIVHQQILFCDC